MDPDDISTPAAPGAAENPATSLLAVKSTNELETTVEPVKKK
jgi:hypothetical protein